MPSLGDISDLTSRCDTGRGQKLCVRRCEIIPCARGR